MQQHNTASGALGGYFAAMGRAIETELRILLEKKHLYQSVTVDGQGARHAFLPEVAPGMKAHLDQTGSLDRVVDDYPWTLANEKMTAVGGNSNWTEVVFTPPHIKTFCVNASCSRLEPFNLSSASSVIGVGRFRSSTPGKFEQILALTYQCQSCKGFPETFLIRRVGAKMTLVGRSPMENVAVPQEIPKELTKFYSGAVIAHQSGQTLAGLFMLRTLCEQWAYKFAAPGDYADQAIDKYMTTLPEDFKRHFPSLRQLYERLSADIHAATGSPDLYDQVIADIGKHFRARELFNLPLSP
jgi:hypothetical protein